MAEAAVVGALAEKFIAMVAYKLFEEVSLFTSFREEFEFLCDELISIKCLLNDVAVESNSTLLCNWLDSLEDFLVDAEGTVEECGTPLKFCNLMAKYRMGRKIKILKERIIKINRSAKYVKYLSSALHVNALNAHNSEDVRAKSSAFIRESHTLGMEHDIDVITKWILKEDGYGVIAILGMGGRGKTLLLQHVFKSEKIRQRFDHLIWLSVSKKFVTKLLLQQIRREIKTRGNQIKARLPNAPNSNKSGAEEDRNRKDQNISKQSSFRSAHEYLSFSKQSSSRSSNEYLSFSKQSSFRSPQSRNQNLLSFSKQSSFRRPQSRNQNLLSFSKQSSFRSPQSRNQNLNEVIEEDVNEYLSFSKQNSFRSPQSGNQNLNEVIEEDVRYTSTEELRDMLHKDLQGKRTLFALDDVWDKDVLEKIGLPFDTQNKIVFTSRDKRVADAMGAHHIHHKACLSEENSWKLFCIHAFPNLAEPPEELSNVARLVVKKCGGLPLALKTIGATMARIGRLPNDWESTLHRLNQPEFMGDRVMQSLTLSYHALPLHLKHCFSYCSLFPKNSEIKSEDLVYLWIAQGFVSVSTQDAAQDLYDVGWSYLKELINRCMIEDSPGGSSCKMHDLLHDLAISESLKQTQCFLKAGGQLEELPLVECRGLRRISLMKNSISTIKKAIHCPRLRTLLLSYNNDLTSICANFFKNMRYLAVLDLSYTHINKLPESIGNLQSLKFLNLSSTDISMLPESFSGLTRLQFLDVSCCKRLIMLHSGIGNHKFLLHLNVENCPQLECLPVGISKLIYLHTLKGAVLKRQIVAKANALQLMDLKRLTFLQQLSLIIDTDSSSSSQGTIQLEEGIFGGMTNMQTLSIKSSWHHLPLTSSILHLPMDMEVIKRVETVRLYRCAVPKWIFQLHNLMELELESDNCSSGYDYRGLEKTPNLRKLRFYRNEKCSEFPQEFGQCMAFPKLQELIVEDFSSLTTFPQLQFNAMPMLQCLVIKDCCKLTNMPQGLERLKSIEVVDLGKVDHLQYRKYVSHGQWRQILTDRGIKIKMDII